MSKNENDKQNSTKRKWEIDEYDTTDKYRNMIEKLADAERNSKLVVFVGAGVSISQGYPNWDGYVDHLIKYWQFNIQSLVSSENISRETILVFDKISRGSFSNKRKIDLVHQILKKLLGDEFEANQLNFEKYYFDDVRPFEPENKTLASLSNLDATFITSNYDTEIERHLDRKRKKPPVVRDLGEFQNTDVYFKISHVLHIHGTAKGNPHLLINSSSAYSRQYFRNRDKFEELVRWFEDSKPVVLFVGVSLEEDELLSLLVKENENFALMKADANANTKVDRDLRNYIEEFFYKENYTKIFWYGDDFDELPIVIKDIVSDIKKINKPTPQQEYWNELNTLETKDEEYLQILNSMLDNRKYHRTLNQFYEHISSSIEEELIKKVLDNSFKSKIFTDESMEVPSNFWDFLDKNYSSIDKKLVTSISKLYLKDSFDPRYVAAFNIYSRLDIERTCRNILALSISKIGYLPATEFSNDSLLMAQWMINQLNDENSRDYLYSLDGDEIVFKFTQDTIKDLNLSLKSDSLKRQLFLPITEIIEDGILGVFYHALVNRRIYYNDKYLMDDFPKLLLENRLIQKILVHIDANEELEVNLLNHLVDVIDFSNKNFGYELNAFINAHEELIDLSRVLYRGKYADTVGKVYSIQAKSFITAEDILTNDVKTIVHILISEKNYYEDPANLDYSNFKTDDETIKFVFRLLQEDNDISKKLKKILIDFSGKLFDRYENLYLKIAIDKKLDSIFVENITKIYLGKINVSRYTNNYSSFFSNFLLNNFDYNEDILDKFLEVDISALDYDNKNNELIELVKLINTELGSYLWSLIKIVKSGKVESSLAKLKFSQIIPSTIRNFSEGSLFHEYDVQQLEITDNTFRGFCYFHSAIAKEDIVQDFINIVIQNLKSNSIVDNLETVPFLIGLYEINPNYIELDYSEDIRFRFMLDIIFTNEESYPYEDEWLKWILDNEHDGSNLNELAYLFSSNNVYLSKVKKIMSDKENYLYEGDSKALLSVFIHQIKENDFTTDKQFFIDLLFYLLEIERIKADIFFVTELEELMDNLDEEQRKYLLNIPYVQHTLTPFESQKLRSKI